MGWAACGGAGWVVSKWVGWESGWEGGGWKVENMYWCLLWYAQDADGNCLFRSVSHQGRQATNTTPTSHAVRSLFLSATSHTPTKCVVTTLYGSQHTRTQHSTLVYGDDKFHDVVRQKCLQYIVPSLPLCSSSLLPAPVSSVPANSSSTNPTPIPSSPGEPGLFLREFRARRAVGHLHRSPAGAGPVGRGPGDSGPPPSTSPLPPPLLPATSGF